MNKIIFLSVIVLLQLQVGNAQKSKPLFKGELGMVSYTYRTQFRQDVPSTLDKIKNLGITDMEFSNLFGKTARELRTLLDQKGIKCSSYGVNYPDLVNKTDEVAANAKTLGAKYVRVAGIPHGTVMSFEEMKKAVDDFNRVGKQLRKQYGLTFIYHNHGFEFQPYEGGTLYDYLVTHTDPKYVSFELDILWAFFPGQDPVALLNKYGKRYKALHVKDLKKGVSGDMSGGTATDNDVALGAGQIDIPGVLKAAQKAKVRHYYIEDESSNIDVQVPQSIEYVKGLRK